MRTEKKQKNTHKLECSTHSLPSQSKPSHALCMNILWQGYILTNWEKSKWTKIYSKLVIQTSHHLHLFLPLVASQLCLLTSSFSFSYLPLLLLYSLQDLGCHSPSFSCFGVLLLHFPTVFHHHSWNSFQYHISQKAMRAHDNFDNFGLLWYTKEWKINI